MAVYRAPMRSRLDGVDPALAVERALAHALVGIGGRLATPPADLARAVAATYETHGERAAARLQRFADVEVGAQVWTCLDGEHLVGTIRGGWRYDASPAAQAADLVHVRDCTWTPPTGGVPEAVLETFGRGGRNFQRIRALG